MGSGGTYEDVLVMAILRTIRSRIHRLRAENEQWTLQLVRWPACRAAAGALVRPIDSRTRDFSGEEGDQANQMRCLRHSESYSPSAP